jgi:diacylglycerol kinase family enzyme
MRVTLIHNPDAGDEHQPAGDRLSGLIRSQGHSVVYHSSKDTHWDAVLKEPGDLVVAAGGDGLVGNIARRLAGSRTPITILPVGTANNVASSLGLADKPLQELVAGWASARPEKFDLWTARGPWGSRTLIEGLGMGLFTDTMGRLDATDQIDLAHARSAGEEIVSVLEMLKDRLESHPVRSVKLKLDDRDLSGAYILLEAMSIRCIGPNLCLAPDADPGDGLLDLVLVTKEQQDRLERYLSDLIAGTPSLPDLVVHRGRRLEIEWEGSVLHLDDQVWPDQDSTPSSRAAIHVEADSHTLQFLVPA